MDSNMGENKGMEKQKGQLIKEFNAFLKKENCLKSYISNLKKGKQTRKSWGHPENEVHFILKFIEEPYSWIQSAFEWSSTKEGHRFWENKRELWGKHLKSKGLRYNDPWSF